MSNSNVPSSLRNLGVTNMNITRLNLRDKNLTSIPKEIGNLKTLTWIDLSSNNLTSLPEEFGKLKNLIHLNLGTNKLRTIPPAIGNLKNLKFLNLFGNELTGFNETDKPNFFGSSYSIVKGYTDRLMHELYNDDVSKCIGICSDNIKKYK